MAGRHARLGPPVRGMGPVRVVQADEQDKIDAAGGINTNAHDVPAWFHAQLNKGLLPNGQRLWSAQQADELWRPQTITRSGAGPNADKPDEPVIEAYALGWDVQNYRGQRLLSHGGRADRADHTPCLAARTGLRGGGLYQYRGPSAVDRAAQCIARPADRRAVVRLAGGHREAAGQRTGRGAEGVWRRSARTTGGRNVAPARTLCGALSRSLVWRHSRDAHSQRPGDRFHAHQGFQEARWNCGAPMPSAPVFRRTRARMRW